MDGHASLDDDLPRLLAALDADPEDGSVRRRACAVALQKALHARDPWLADVAETLAAEAPRPDAFVREAAAARAARRAIADRADRADGPPTHADRAVLAPA